MIMGAPGRDGRHRPRWQASFAIDHSKKMRPPVKPAGREHPVGLAGQVRGSRMHGNYQVASMGYEALSAIHRADGLAAAPIGRISPAASTHLGLIAISGATSNLLS
jgi:hypothetical protein